jgi:predicted nucleotidyltransferase
MSGDARASAAERIRRVARAMGDVHEQLVFLGASVLPLLAEVDHRLAAPRTTKDVDAVAATTSYLAMAKLEESLRARGFRRRSLGHAGRWLSP